MTALAAAPPGSGAVDVAVVVAVGVLGLLIGPLVNVLVDRVPERERLLPLRSRCPAAGDDAAHHGGGLGAYVRLLAGRCPGCGGPLPGRYLVVELATAAMFAAAGLRFGADWALPAYLLLFASLLAISVIDLELFIIPNRIVYPTMFASVPLLALAAAAQDRWPWFEHALIGGAVAWALLLVIHLVSPAGMGFGDVRLAFVLGLFLGWISLAHVFTGLFLGFLLGAVTGVALVVIGRRGRKDAIPFGPFLAAGAVVAVLVGTPVAHWLIGTG